MKMVWKRREIGFRGEGSIIDGRDPRKGLANRCSFKKSLLGKIEKGASLKLVDYLGLVGAINQDNHSIDASMPALSGQ